VCQVLPIVRNFGFHFGRDVRYRVPVARKQPWNPNTADWLVAQRGKRTQDQVVADLAERGVQLKRAWLSRIENGAPFSQELLEAFQDYYGSVPPPYETKEEGATPSGDALVAAIDRQTAAIERQTAVMELLLSRLGGLPAPDPAAEAEAHTATGSTSGMLPHRLPDPTPAGR
jgi:hypothetical protein